MGGQENKNHEKGGSTQEGKRNHAYINLKGTLETTDENRYGRHLERRGEI